MNDISIYFQEVSDSETWKEQQLGSYIVKNQGGFPALEKNACALIYVPEFRGSGGENSSSQTHFRKALYTLHHEGTWNLPFYDLGQVELSSEESLILEDIDTFISRGHKFIIHQGVINIEREESKLAMFSSILKPPYKILIIGASRRNFDSFIEKYNLEVSSFYFVGKVRYHVLNFFWKRGIASVVMYAPTLLNNRLCAPNRFYISLNSGLPVFINKDNLVLQNLIREFHCGYEIESFGMDFDLERIQGVQPIILKGFSDLKKSQVLQFLNVYQNLTRFSKS
jgi:hypothetical protein